MQIAKSQPLRPTKFTGFGPASAMDDEVLANDWMLVDWPMDGGIPDVSLESQNPKNSPVSDWLDCKKWSKQPQKWGWMVKKLKDAKRFRMQCKNMVFHEVSSYQNTQRLSIVWARWLCFQLVRTLGDWFAKNGYTGHIAEMRDQIWSDMTYVYDYMMIIWQLTAIAKGQAEYDAWWLAWLWKEYDEELLTHFFCIGSA